MKQKNGVGMGFFSRVCIGLIAGLMGSLVYAQQNIESIEGVMQGQTEVLRIDFSHPPEVQPTGFTVQSPARIALDFPETASTVGRALVEINQGNLVSASVAQAGGRSRVVLNLKKPTSYTSKIQDNSLYVILDPVAAPVIKSASASFAEGGNADIYPLKDLDFRRSPDGVGRVIVTLPNNRVGVDLQQQGGTLVAEFLKSSLPQGLQRRLDVTDFATPVQAVTTTQAGERVRMVIEAKGDWEHSAYQSDDQFVIEVREKKIDSSKLSQGQGFTGEKLSLNFQSIELRALLQVIADFTNFNIVTSDTVVGTVTLRLKDVPWDQALQIIMDAKGLGLEKNGSVMWIAPKDEIDARKKRDMEAALAIEKLEPLRTQAFQMNYAKAVDMVVQLRGDSSSTGASRFLSERGSVIAEPRTNQLFVTDTAQKLAQVQELISKLDVAVRQVLIEAKIVEASESFGRSLGVKLGGGDLRAQAGGQGGYQISGDNRFVLGTNYGNATASSGFGGSVNVNGNFVNLPASGQGGANPASLAVSIFNSAANRFLTLELSAMEADGKGKLVASPRVVTADQTAAIIEQGTEIPYQEASSSGASTTSFKKANLKLEVTPQITPEGNVILDLDVNKDSPGEPTPGGLAIDTKHIKTQVLIENGGTVVIGGIYTMDEKSSEQKVPFLGDLPLLGNLFKSRTQEWKKTELLVFITPKIIVNSGATR